MQKCNIWKPESNKYTLPTRLSLINEQQKKKHNIQGDMTLLGKDCEVEKMMTFLREIGIFEKI